MADQPEHATPRSSAPPLVGRDREQAALRDALDAALAERGSLVLIGGEAGIGKTAIAETLLAEAAERGARALVGRCYDLGETPPYGPWTEICARVPEGAALPPPLGAGGAVASQAALFARVQAVLADATVRTPLVVVLEDLHWADAASLDLLRIVGRNLGALPLLLLATYRDDELAEGQPLAASLPGLVREARPERLTLSRLSAADTQSLVRARYQLLADDEARLSGHLHTHAEGNPLYLGEVLRSLEEEGLLHPAAEGAGWALGDLTAVRVPPLLRQVIGARVTRLGADTVLLLTIAAVIGPAVPLDLWSAIGEASDDALAAVVGPAVAARVLTETPDGQGVRFAHALVRDALYEAIPLPRRRVLHHHIADALLAMPAPDPDAVAHHLQRSGDPRAAEWLIRAGDRALHAYALLAAGDRYEAALALLDAQGAGAGERGWLMLRLARTRRYDNSRRGLTFAELAFHQAEASSDPALSAVALHNLGHHRCRTGDFRQGTDDMLAAQVLFAALSVGDRARLDTWHDGLPPAIRDANTYALATFLALAGRYAESRVVAERGLVATPPPQGTDAGNMHHGLAIVHAALGEPERARTHFAAARAFIAASGRQSEVGLNYQMELIHVTIPYAADRPEERERLAAQAEAAWGRVTGAVRGEAPPGLGRLAPLFLAGDWDVAHAGSLAAHTAGGIAAPNALLVRAMLALARGEDDLAWSLVREQLPDGPATEPGNGWLHVGLPLQRVAAALALRGGDRSTAKAWLDGHDRWLAWSGTVRHRADGQLSWAAYHRAAGDPGAAWDAAEHALALATEPRQPLPLLAIHRLLGELATETVEYAVAATQLDAALALADACAAPYERALTLTALAELRHAEGQHEAAQALLAEARAILAGLGARPTLERCENLAACLPGPIRIAVAEEPARAPTGLPRPAQLTEREAEVLRLIAAGQSNREMAATLCRSERTIERHIENLYRKIDAHSKVEATAFAFRHGLA
jgi:DNA-binding CsgD family transcriptional regulator